MESDPLQQLRDVHLPADPGWWPPAIGWWILALALLAGLIWGVYLLVAAYRRRAPIRAAKALLTELHNAHGSGQISTIEFLHQGNELLKRLLVRAYKRREYASLSGDAWLVELDEISASKEFTSGTGKILGQDRFSRDPQVDVNALNDQLRLVVDKVRP